MIIHKKLKVSESDLYIEIPLTKMDKNLKAVITLNRAGDMGFLLKDKLHYRSNFYKLLKIQDSSVFTINQKHTKRVFVVEEDDKPTDFYTQEGDGFITSLCWPILGVTAADCLPLFLLDKIGSTYGIVHSGWQGTGIVVSALQLLKQRFKVAPENIIVIMGPAIGSCCYNVSLSRAQVFCHRFGNTAIEKRNGEYYLDLRQANINLLLSQGVDDIIVIDDCTCCNSLYGSYRREGERNFNKMLALIGPLHA